ncbi:MAG TPA: hypothetical protein VK975_06665 [Acidimicrobiales bacterium]|nr:hypothetical protein [Acidimicrobiales bacterium]
MVKRVGGKEWFFVAVIAAAGVLAIGVWQLNRGNRGGWIIIAGAVMQVAVAWAYGYRVSRQGEQGTMKAREPDKRTIERIMLIKLGVVAFTVVVFVGYAIYSLAK